MVSELHLSCTLTSTKGFCPHGLLLITLNLLTMAMLQYMARTCLYISLGSYCKCRNFPVLCCKQSLQMKKNKKKGERKRETKVAVKIFSINTNSFSNRPDSFLPATGRCPFDYVSVQQEVDNQMMRQRLPLWAECLKCFNWFLNIS